MNALTRFEDALRKFGSRPGGSGTWSCPGPMHANGDRNPSLSVSQGDKGVVIHCHTGCATDDVLIALGVSKPELFDGYVNAHDRAEAPPRVVARYDYTDEKGELLYQVERLEPKGFRQRRSDGVGGFVYKLGDVRRVPYRLPELLRAIDAVDPIWICEGEKDADAMHEADHVATCNAGGAGKWRPEFSAYLKSADVTIVADKDEPGRKHAREVAASLVGVATSVLVVEAKTGKDAFDHLEAGHCADDFVPVSAAKPEDEARGATGRLLDQADSRDSGAVLLRLEGVEPRPVEWLWYGRIPRGKVTILDGDPDVGKSTITLDWAARVSIGAAMPDGAAGLRGGVVLLSAEDDAADTIVPRLIAAGADLTRIRLLEGVRTKNGETRPAALPSDLGELEAAILETEAVLVVVDPLMAFLDGDTNAHRDQDVRRALAPLARLAESTGIALLVVRHLNKSSGGHALYRGGGSIGIIGAARSGLLAARDPDDETRRVLAVTKANLAERAPSLSYSLLGTGQTVRVEWHGNSPHSSSSLLAVPLGDEERSAVQTAAAFLEEELRVGPASPKDIFANARRAGIAEVTLRRAKVLAGVITRKTGMHAGWVWQLRSVDAAPKMINGSEDAQPVGMITFGEDDRLRASEPTPAADSSESRAPLEPLL